MSHLKFLHISDTHYRKEYMNTLGRWGVIYNPVSIFEKFLSDYDFSSIDFVAHTGDIAHDGFKDDYMSFKVLMEEYIPRDIPIYYCLGNHDKKKDFNQAFFNNNSNHHYYHLEYINGYRLIFLDTSSEEIHDGKIDQEQADWLFEILETPYGQGTLVFQHHPLEISWVRGLEETVIPEYYVQKLVKTDVLGIFTGHLHQNRHVMIESIPQHTAGSFVFGMNRIDNEIWNTNRLGYSEVEVLKKQIDVYTEIVNPEVTKTNKEIL